METVANNNKTTGIQFQKQALQRCVIVFGAVPPTCKHIDRAVGRATVDSSASPNLVDHGKVFSEIQYLIQCILINTIFRFFPWQKSCFLKCLYQNNIHKCQCLRTIMHLCIFQHFNALSYAVFQIL